MSVRAVVLLPVGTRQSGATVQAEDVLAPPGCATLQFRIIPASDALAAAVGFGVAIRTERSLDGGSTWSTPAIGSVINPDPLPDDLVYQAPHQVGLSGGEIPVLPRTRFDLEIPGGQYSGIPSQPVDAPPGTLARCGVTNIGSGDVQFGLVVEAYDVDGNSITNW